SLKTLKKRIKSGISLLIFPEGTQNRTAQPLQPFYDGAFRIAIETQTPVLPIVVVNAGKLMHPSGLTVKPGKIKVVFGEPLSVENYRMDQVKELKQKTYDIMEKMLADNPIDK
ncbi:MAG: lysophospholipid acyltransferase family protein, partial [Bacteroidota bacterium]